MADDLEAFLRQAAQRRAQRQSTAPRPAAPAAPAPPAARPAAPAPPPRPPLTPTASAPPRRPPPRLTPAAEVARVGTRVSTAEFEQRAEHLGEEVGLADEHMDAHIAQKFDHQVGSLDLDAASPAGGGSAELTIDAADVLAMLTEPQVAAASCGAERDPRLLRISAGEPCRMAQLEIAAGNHPAWMDWHRGHGREHVRSPARPRILDDGLLAHSVESRAVA